MARRGYVDHRTRTVFFWSQKAACMTLFRTLSWAHGDGARNVFFIRISKPWQDCLPLIRNDGYRAVVVARHPALRAASCYLNKFCVYNDRALTRRGHLEPFAQALHDRFCALRGLQTGQNLMTFEDFLDTIADLFAERTDPDQPSVNGHWDTQVPPGLLAQGFRYDRIIHVEALDAELGALCADLGLPFTASALNATPLPAPDGPRAYLGRTPAQAIAGLPFDHASFLAPPALDRIARLYAPDFAMFGYPLLPAGSAPLQA